MKFIGKLEKLDDVVETLSQSLFKVGDGIKMGVANKSTRYQLFTRWSDRNVSRIREFYASDFDQFGYDDGQSGELMIAISRLSTLIVAMSQVKSDLHQIARKL